MSQRVGWWINEQKKQIANWRREASHLDGEERVALLRAADLIDQCLQAILAKPPTTPDRPPGYRKIVLRNEDL
jgi:hypothetical protein